MSERWWVTRPGGVPVGPAAPELVIQGIGAGAVPLDALVCPMGGTEWKPLAEVAEFAAAVTARRRARSHFAESEGTAIDLGPLPDSEPPPRPSVTSSISLERFDETSESTVVDESPFSDPKSD